MSLALCIRKRQGEDIVTTTEPSSLQADTRPGSDLFHVCILGPSGIGKSPLASLFWLPGLDPLRVREPRDEKDRALCISESDAIDLYHREAPGATPWPTPKAANNWFAIGEHWLFMSVRGDRQCLRFKEDNGTPVLRSRRRIEVFGPRLLDILRNKNGCQSRIDLNPSNVVILLLNPSAQTYDEMSGSPDDDLKQATFYAITKRAELQGKPVDVPDSQKRVRRLADELQAWVSLKHLDKLCCLEYTAWPHFEFRYHQSEKGGGGCPKRATVSSRYYPRWSVCCAVRSNH